MDLYREARELPWLLKGGLNAVGIRQLRLGGASERAIRWRTGKGRLQRPQRGAYLAGAGNADLLDEVRAALIVSPPNAVIAFHTAASLLGFGVVPSRTIHIVVPAGTPFPQRPGITVHQSVVPVDEPIDILGVPCTPAARCAVDLARTLRRLDSLPVLDAALYATACDIYDLLVELKVHDGLRGIRQVRDLVPLADPRAHCRQESQLRLIIHDGGLRGFEPQLPVVDDDGFTRHYLDLGDRHYRVGAEYDGSSHLDKQRMRADRTRHNWLEGRGWRMRYFTDQDLYFRAEGIVDTIRSARRRPSI